MSAVGGGAAEGSSPSGDDQAVTAAKISVETVDTSGSIKNDVISGAKWASVSKLTTQGMQFLVGLVLARLLAPEDFGLLASIYVITAFAQLFFEMGLGAALVQRTAPSERDKATVFWINALSGLIYAGIMWAIAPLVAEFFDAPRLVALMPVVALTFTLSLGVVHGSLLQRQLRFRTLAVVELSSAAAGHLTTLIAALLGVGALALALGPLVTAGLMSILLFCIVKWRPRHFVNRASFRELWRFSGGLLGFNVVNYWGRNADNLLIGRFLGAAPLGFYNRAYNLMLLPVTQITGALGRVMFPALAAIKHDHARVRSAYLRTLGMINFLTIPALVGLAAVSDGLVPLLWGEQWVDVVPVLQVLCIAGVPQCVVTTVGWLYQSQGRTSLMFLMGVIGSVAGVIAMAVGLQWGVEGVAWAVLLKSWVMAPIALAVSGRIVSLKLSVTLKNAAPTFLVSAVMGVAAWGLPALLSMDRSAPVTLAAQVVVGIVIFAVGSVTLERPRLREVQGLVARRRSV